MLGFRFRIPSLAVRKKAGSGPEPEPPAELEGRITALTAYTILRPVPHKAMVTALTSYTILKEAE